MLENRLEMRQTQRLSLQLQTAIRLLSSNLEDLNSEFQKAATHNPSLEIIPPQKNPQEFNVLFRPRNRSPKGSSIPEGYEPAAQQTALDDLMQQLRLCRLDDATQRTARQMLHLLTPHGYFPQELDVFATEAGVSEEIARSALAAIQSLEPAGVGARSVEECLELQLQAKSGVDALCCELVRHYLPDIANGSYRQIARKTGVSEARVRTCVEVIRRLTPFPCSLDQGDVHYILPEFSVETDDSGQLTVIFHNDYFPSLRMDESFVRLSEGLTGEELAFAQRLKAEATRIIQASELRQTTMQRLADIIVREQRAFFLHRYSVLPLRVDDVAREMGVHETTIYRAVQGKYLYCSRGLLPLNYFFPKEVSGGTSTTRVKELIAEYCRVNEKVSDRAIAEMLEERDITISRRTVAKYRAQMDIESSFHRDK